MRVLVVGSEVPGLCELLSQRGDEHVTADGPAAARHALARGPTPELAIVSEPCAAAIRAIRSHVRGEAVLVLALVPDTAVERALDDGAAWVVPIPATRGALAAALAGAQRAVARAERPGPALDHDLYFTRNPHPMWFFDVDTLRFVAVNDAAVAKYGWSRDELLGGMTLADIRPPEDVERLLQVTSRVASGLDVSRGWRHRTKSGRTLEVDIISYPVQYEGRACELVLANDVSERVRAQGELEELRAQVEASERLAAIGTLAAGVGHEVSAPLTLVLANLSFVEDGLSALEGTAAAELREVAREASQAALKVRQIAADLKGYARFDDALGPVELERVVGAALTLAQGELRQRARVKVAVAGAPAPIANEGRLGQVLLNLVVNAAHAIAPGAPDRNLVSISARAEGEDRVAIEVSDTGAGVPAPLQVRIFEPFFTTKPPGNGTGLGLWVCRRILDAIGGELRLVPRDGPGATFRVTLPAVRAEKRA